MSDSPPEERSRPYEEEFWALGAEVQSEDEAEEARRFPKTRERPSGTSTRGPGRNSCAGQEGFCVRPYRFRGVDFARLFPLLPPPTAGAEAAKEGVETGPIVASCAPFIFSPGVPVVHSGFSCTR